MKIRPGFGRGEQMEDSYNRYIGKYVVIYIHGQQASFSGKINSIVDGHVLLNPFTGGEWDIDKGLTRKLMHEDSVIRVSDIAVIEPITKENLETYLIFSSKQEAKKLEEKSQANK